MRSWPESEWSELFLGSDGGGYLEHTSNNARSCMNGENMMIDVENFLSLSLLQTLLWE